MHAAVPPQVEYEPTELGHGPPRPVKGLAGSLVHRPQIDAARRERDAKADMPS
ncbi:hypothetical protein ACWGE1_00315 [Streptomyces sp. NPDC054932]